MQKLLLFILFLTAGFAQAETSADAAASQYLNDVLKGSAEKAVAMTDLAQLKTSLKNQSFTVTDGQAQKILATALTTIKDEVKTAELKSITIGEASYNEDKTEADIPFTINTAGALPKLTNTELTLHLKQKNGSWIAAFPVTEAPEGTAAAAGSGSPSKQ